MKTRVVSTAVLAAFPAALVVSTASAAPAAAEHFRPATTAVVTEWNQVMIDAIELAASPPPPAMRIGAIVQASVFDAVNGITHRYAAFHVPAAAPHGASAPAAAAGAAHEALSKLFPTQQPTFDARLTDTLAQLQGEADNVSLARGLAWGNYVADQIVEWRANDGISATLPPYVPSNAPGRWQPTPPLFGPPQFREFANMVPFAMASPSQFLPSPPPALTSLRYTLDFAEVKIRGSATSVVRSAFDAQTAQFWQSDRPVAMWDRVTDDLITSRDLALTDAARLLAQTNISMADAVVAIWNAKNYYDRWRPVTAIQRANTDGNPFTIADPAWQPLIPTPVFQEYPAGHPGVSQAAAAVLADRFGDGTTYTVSSAAMPGVTRTLHSFTSGVAQVTQARIDGGIHFRFACDVATHMGRGIAALVLDTQMQPVHR